MWSIRRFDDRYTAPHHGFNGAEDYYHRASAMRVIDRVARPALILSAADDPFVPPHIFDAPAVRDNPHITTIITLVRRSLRVRGATFAKLRRQARTTTATSPRRPSSISSASQGSRGRTGTPPIHRGMQGILRVARRV